MMGGAVTAAIAGLPQGDGAWGSGIRWAAPRGSCYKCALCQAALQRLGPSFADIALYERRVCWGEVSLWLAAPLRVESHRAALLGELQTLSASGPAACLPSASSRLEIGVGYCRTSSSKWTNFSGGMYVIQSRYCQLPRTQGISHPAYQKGVPF